MLKLYLAAVVVQAGCTGFVMWTKSYLHHARTSEAPSVLVEIGRAAETSFARDGKLCASATATVPRRLASLPGLHRDASDGYWSQRAEWAVDAEEGAGFSCLGFEMNRPQRFLYDYESTPTSFVVRAMGDPEYTGHPSAFELRGVVKNGTLVVGEPVETTR